MPTTEKKTAEQISVEDLIDLIMPFMIEGNTIEFRREQILKVIKAVVSKKCAEQRDICAESAELDHRIVFDTTEFFIDKDSIRNAKAPEI